MRVLITGGTGSLGSALVHHYLHAGAEKIVVFSRDEVKQGALATSLGFTIDHTRVRFFLGDVRDYWRLVDACWHVDTIVHTAALKRVDQVSYNPTEVLRTNVLGTVNVLRAAVEAHVSKVLLISSDKAVHPTNVYGASKQMAEFLTVRHNVFAIPRGTRCSVLRYGNVWGSRGSLVEVFQQQMVRTGTLTVTDPAMTRFFVTLPQAVEYVLEALLWMDGGEIFVPRLSAWSLGQVIALFHPIAVTTVGRRPGGEKYHEQLISDEEEHRVIELGSFYVVLPDVHEWTTVHQWETVERSPVHAYTSDRADRVVSTRLVEAMHGQSHDIAAPGRTG